MTPMHRRPLVSMYLASALALLLLPDDTHGSSGKHELPALIETTHANKPSEAELDALATSCNLCEEAVKYARSWSNDETVRDKQALDDLFMDACTRIKSELGDHFKWHIEDCEATRRTIVDDMSFSEIVAS